MHALLHKQLLPFPTDTSEVLNCLRAEVGLTTPDEQRRRPSNLWMRIFEATGTVAIKIDNCLPFTCWFSNSVARSINLKRRFLTTRREKRNKFSEMLFINNKRDEEKTRLLSHMRRNLIKMKILLKSVGDEQTERRMEVGKTFPRPLQFYA